MSYLNIHTEIKAIYIVFTGYKIFNLTFDDIYTCKCRSIKNMNYITSVLESEMDDEILCFKALFLNKQLLRDDYDAIENLIKNGTYPDYLEVLMFNGDVTVYELLLEDYKFKVERTPYLDLCVSIYKEGHEHDYELPKEFDHREYVEKVNYKSSQLKYLLLEEDSKKDTDFDDEF